MVASSYTRCGTEGGGEGGRRLQQVKEGSALGGRPCPQGWWAVALPPGGCFSASQIFSLALLFWVESSLLCSTLEQLGELLRNLGAQVYPKLVKSKSLLQSSELLMTTMRPHCSDYGNRHSCGLWRGCGRWTYCPRFHTPLVCSARPPGFTLF